MSAKNDQEQPNLGNVVETPLGEALSERYLSYALSTIMSRSLPDVRDGLKPVHRRLMHAMREQKLTAKSSHKKSARVVGYVMGQYHPHGDMAIYDALVRLAQDFSVRYPLVDGQGNFGNIDGDNAAAMRYTESRLTEVAEALLHDIDKGAIDFRPTYDGAGEEPTVLPARFPNLLANGAVGIAVGMATSVPPHNVGEICDALKHLIDTPQASIEKLVSFIQGPDFPTGGVLVESLGSIIQSYKTGKGGFRLRARWEVEQLKGGSYQIIITEIPYQVQKSKLIERIADLILSKKVHLLANVQDESSEDIRIVLEPKNRNVQPEVLMEQLFKLSDLETRASLNMNVLDGKNIPRVMNLREVLQAFLDHRHDVLVRCSNYRLEEIIRRLEILDGYLIAHLNIDEVIKIIREEDKPKPVMMARWDLTDLQAESILNMRLRSLRKLEEFEIKKEHTELSEEKSGLESLLADESLRWSHIKDEVKDIKKNFGPKSPGGGRRTIFGQIPDNIDISAESLIEKEPVTILCSQKGWIRSLKGHVSDTSDVKHKEGDEAKFELQAHTTDKLVIACDNGRFYTLGIDKLPGGRGYGEPVRLMFEMENDAQIIQLFIANLDKEANMRRLVASNAGRGFVVHDKDIVAQTKNGRQVMTFATGSKLQSCAPVQGDGVAVIGDNRRLLVFKLDEIPELTKGKGVILQRYQSGGLADIKTFSFEQGLQWEIGAKTRTETDLRLWFGKRAQSGRLPPSGFPRTNKFNNN